MLVLVIACALQTGAPQPAPSSPPALSVPGTLTLPKGLGTAPTTYGATVTVQVSGVKAPKKRPPTPPAQLQAGKKLYAQRCALCHGDAGAADGVGARRITPEPQHLNDVIWQGAVSDAEIEKAILLGGAAVSRSPMMPANPDLKTKKPLVTSLVAYVRSLRAPFGSVTATATPTIAAVTGPAGSPAKPAPGPVVVRADADKGGQATVVFPNLPRGKTTIAVMVDENGTVGCTVEVDVVSDVTVRCPPPPAP
jgi:mono/diheme cytochrome c family protein